MKSKILEYHKIYNKEVLPVLNQFEYVRRDILREFHKTSFCKCLLPIIILGLICIGGVTFNFQNNNDMLFAICLFSLAVLLPAAIIVMPILYWDLRNKENIKFTNLMKVKVIQNLLNVFGDIKWKGHNPSEKNCEDVLLSDNDLNASGLFISFNTRYTDDEFEGNYKEVSFKISETKMFDIHGSGKNKTCICAFNGIILSFKFNKEILNRTIVSTKGDLTKKNQCFITALTSTVIFLDIFKDGYSHWKIILILTIFVIAYLISKQFSMNEEKLDKVILEDPRFEKRFDVYSSDQVEARYLVTPAFMHRFYNLNTAFGAKKAKCSFYGDTLMIAIQTNRNLFEICNLFMSLKNPLSINNFYRELSSIYSMIEYFKLDKKTYR